MSGTTWVHRAARWSVRPLVGTWVKPNHITTVRLLSGIAAAAMFAVGDRQWDIWAGVVFVVSAFLDRADGELARLSGQTSEWGHTYDVASDMTVTVITFIAIGIGLRTSALGYWAIVMGVVTGITIAAIYQLAFVIERSSAAKAFAGAGGFDPDDALFVIGPIAWLGALKALLIAAVIGAPLFLLFTLLRYRQRKRAA
ncbi:MAG: CDP-alcohol phosphatidyltransferase family protein [Burkholderiaceae bacterium]